MNGSGTFSLSDTLPRVPLYSLPGTCDRFLDWCRPLLSFSDYLRTETALKSFCAPGGAGRILHEELVRFNDSPDANSWLDQFWHERYLSRRDPIALNANFFFLFQDTNLNQIDRAVYIISGALHYKKQLDKERLPITQVRSAPLCMEGIKATFATTRIPDRICDKVLKPYSKEQPGPSSAKHILVCCKGQMYSLDVLDRNGTPFSLTGIKEALVELQRHVAVTKTPGQYIGNLTAMPREEWAQTYEQLREDNNASQLDRIESALFLIALDDDAPDSDLRASDLLLHGNSFNRYYDKAVNFVVFANGRAGLNGEHSCLDGTTTIEMINFIHSMEAEEHALRSGAQYMGVPEFSRLEFNLSDRLVTKIASAYLNFRELAGRTVTRVFNFRQFGIKHVKELKASPDAFFQLAMQIAHYNTKFCIGTTYEALSARQFRYGRTEAMRVITPEIIEFVKGMNSSEVLVKEKYLLFRSAESAHLARLRQCQEGKAPEQHLWELLMIYYRAKEKLAIQADFPEGVPFEFYRSPGWQVLRNDFLCTSSVPSEHVCQVGFGATSPDCIGIAYNMRPDSIDAYLCVAESQEEVCEEFIKQLELALEQLSSLLASQLLI